MAKNRPAEVAAATHPVALAREAARATPYASRAGRAGAAKLRPALTPGRQREAVVLRPSPSIRQGGPVPRVDAHRTTSRRALLAGIASATPVALLRAPSSGGRPGGKAVT